MVCMYARYAKRLFTKQAIEKWFDRITNDWERAFSKEELKTGRLLYRRGDIREVELTETDAIVHCKIEKQESYAMIDWKNGSFEVRASPSKRSFGRAIAVAGFYEIEELVIDEASPSPEIFDAEPEEEDYYYEPAGFQVPREPRIESEPKKVLKPAKAEPVLPIEPEIVKHRFSFCRL